MVTVMRRVPLFIVVAAVAVATAACSSSGSSGSSSPDKAAGPRYVALGDSYSAGPQIAPGDGLSGACDRSLVNYPHLVAKKVGAASFTDVSCSGATTANVLHAAPIGAQGPAIPAQLDAVKANTTLVTIGIGGNDDSMFSKLSTACTQPGTACADYLKDKLPTVLRSTRQHVATTIEAIKSKAPKAEVLLVGYLGVSPPNSGCAALGGAALDTRGVSAGERSINSMLSSAAADSGATYVSMSILSKGHDACAGDNAWTNGITPKGLGEGASLHPRPSGMAAVATAVEGDITAK
ncbi:MAG: family lipase [Aeromicrobium sp.]|nr:family lipase [Aeromicrobium sp.]